MINVIIGQAREIKGIDGAVFTIDLAVLQVIDDGILFGIVFIAVIAGNIVLPDAVLADLDFADTKQLSLLAA